MPRWTLLAALLSLPVAAQTATITVPELFVLPNEGRNPAGQIEGIEGGAFTARARDVGAVYYNPAGLGLSKRSSVSAASAAYEWTFYSGEVGDVADTGSRLSSNGRLFGFVVGGDVLKDERLSLGFAIPTPVAWKPTLQLSGILGGPAEGAGLLYSADGSYSDIVPTIAAGYALRPGLRVGGSLGLSFLSLSQIQDSFAEGVTGDGAALAQTSFRADGTSYDLLLSAGLQWDLAPSLTLGVVAAAPGLRLGGSTSLLVQQTTATSGGYRSSSFRDPEAELTVKHTARLSVGVAWRFPHGEVEADVKVFAGASPYELFASAAPGHWTVTTPAGTDSGTAVLTPARDERRAIANVMIGGRYDVGAKTSLHLGFFTARSPVGDESVFSIVDLTGVSAGVSLRLAHVSGSLGFVYEWGEQEIAVGPGDGSPSLSGGLGISSVHLLWGLTYTF